MTQVSSEPKSVSFPLGPKRENPATLQFFAVLEKDKPFRVLPAVLNYRRMTIEEMMELPLKTALAGKIVIPSQPEPWSKISEDADHFFLMLQSRETWGQDLRGVTNLLEVKAIRELVELLEESLNNYSWRKDLLEGKFQGPSLNQPQTLKETSFEEGVNPGQNWK